jgi:hypothetical protein
MLARNRVRLAGPYQIFNFSRPPPKRAGWPRSGFPNQSGCPTSLFLGCGIGEFSKLADAAGTENTCPQPQGHPHLYQGLRCELSSLLAPSHQRSIIIKPSKAISRMKANLLCTILLGLGLLSSPAFAQSGPPAFPLAGDWDGDITRDGVVYHLVLHMNSTPEGKMTALLDLVDQKISSIPAIGGSFDGTHLTLRFFTGSLTTLEIMKRRSRLTTRRSMHRVRR